MSGRPHGAGPDGRDDIGLGSRSRVEPPPRPLRETLTTNPARVLALGFAVLITIGTAVLMLPASTASGESPPLLTALFTATSAVCVTGLTVVDTAGYWSGFGQVALLVMFQVGGFGILTGTAVAFLALTRRLGFRGRLMASAERQESDASSLRRVLIITATVTVVTETAVALSLFLALLDDGHDAASAAWRGLFHSVSAFNQAGFALWPDSLAGFGGDPWIILSVAVAILLGGIGVPVWMDVRRDGLRWRRYTLHTKLTLLGSAVLLVAGFAVLTASEWDNPATLGAHGVGGRLLDGFFASVTPRSGGFSTFDYGAAEIETLLVTDALMFIGGGSASTAGGIKVGTFVLLMLVVWSEMRGKTEVDAFARTVPDTVLKRAFSVAFLAIVVVSAGTLGIVLSGPFSFEDALFETLSAFATVGLSTGITPQLDDGGRIIVIVLMFVGRVGLVTVALALALREEARRFTYPEERPLVG